MKSFFNNWKSSFAKLHSIKYLSLIAITIAMKITLGAFFIPISENLRIYISFVITVIEAAMIGPAAGIVSGGITDILGFMIHPSGAFFFGYTISSMLGSFIYAIFLYNQKIKLWRIFCSKLCVNLFVNVLLGSLWSTMMFSKGYIFYATKSLIKNITLLPLEVFLIYLLFKMVLPILEKRDLIQKQDL